MRLIDADALIERIQYSFHNHERARIDTVTETFLSEDCSPTIEARPVVRGEWEMDAKNHCHCSNCHDGRNIETQIGWNYCPNCGADMRPKEESEDAGN